jgi:hypothetical protein
VKWIRARSVRHDASPCHRPYLSHHRDEYVLIFRYHLQVHLVPACLLPVGQAVIALNIRHRCHAYLAAGRPSDSSRCCSHEPIRSIQRNHMPVFILCMFSPYLLSRLDEDTLT